MYESRGEVRSRLSSVLRLQIAFLLFCFLNIWIANRDPEIFIISRLLDRITFDCLLNHVITYDFLLNHVITCDFLLNHVITFDFLLNHVITYDFLLIHVGRTRAGM